MILPGETMLIVVKVSGKGKEQIEYSRRISIFVFMGEEKKKKSRFVNWLKNKFRFVIMDAETFEERASFVMSPLSFLIFIIAATIFMITLVTYIIAFTPLREYIPGYADVTIRKNIVALSLKADSLHQDLMTKGFYIENLNNIVQGRPMEGRSEKAAKDSIKKHEYISTRPSKEDSLLRAEIESQDKYSLSLNGSGKSSKRGISNFFFFAPINGIVTNTFRSTIDHYGVDVAAPKNEAVKATLDGAVILANWTSETGYTIAIQHDNEIVSVYKHNSVLLKRAGERVKAGEAIAIVGDSGELTSGPHLHFELWYKGAPVDPQEHIRF